MPVSDEQATEWFHWFTSAAYFLPFVGALISDIWLAKYRTIIYFSLVYCVGLIAMTVDDTRLGLGLGLVLTAIGSGIIKPCVAANVGDQFGEMNKHLLSRFYGWFYFAINLGAADLHVPVPVAAASIRPVRGIRCPGGPHDRGHRRLLGRPEKARPHSARRLADSSGRPSVAKGSR